MNRASRVAVWLAVVVGVAVALLPWAATPVTAAETERSEAASQAGQASRTGQVEKKTMAQVTVEKLGDFESTARREGQISNSADESDAIVFWRGSQVAGALYYSWKSNSVLFRFKQRLASVDTKGPRHAALSAFPITFSGSVDRENGEEASNVFDIDHVMTVDLNGDGLDELVVPRHQGELEVYGLDKRLYHWKSNHNDAKHFQHRVMLAHKARIAGRDIVHYVYRKSVWLGMPAQEAAKQEKPVDTLLEVSGSGIQEIKLQGLPGPIDKIVGVGVLNRPGSQQFDALVICSQLQGSKAKYLSLHHRDGRLQLAAREIYGDGANARLWHFQFVPQSNLLVAIDAGNHSMVFVGPYKPVNWFQFVDIRGKLNDAEVGYRGVLDVPSNEPKAMWEDRMNHVQYVIDRNGDFYTLEDGTYVVHKDKVAWAEVKMATNKHGLSFVALVGDDKATVLAIQSKRDTVKDLSLEELQEAAAKFFSPEKLAATNAFYAPTFENMNRMVPTPAELAKQRALAVSIATIEDVQRYLPDYYDEKLVALAGQMHSSLLVDLTYHHIDESDTFIARNYRNIPAHRVWLESLKSPSEVRVQLMRGNEVISESVLSDTQVSGTGEGSTIPAKWTALKRAQSDLKVVLPLIRTEGKTVGSGFYLLGLQVP